MKRTYAVIGDPVSHSRSPELYAPMFRRFGIDAEFLRLRVGIDALPELHSLVRRHRLCGFAVTMPLKRAILGQLDAISDGAREAGAANIVTVSESGLTGYNTDGEGLIRVFEELGTDISGGSVVILGGGGAALGAGAAVKRHGGTAVLIRRSPGTRIESVIDAYARAGLLREARALVNATPLGMAGFDAFENTDFLRALAPSAAVVDMVYSDGGTALVHAAHGLGLRACAGGRLLYHQGVLAFGLWTGFDYAEN